MMIARIIEKHVNNREQRIERFDRLRQSYRRCGVDGSGLDHAGEAG
jgi:hypothetical protein